MLESWDAAERVMLQIPGRDAFGGEDVERDEFVGDAFFLQRHPRDAHIDTVVRAVEDWLGHAAGPSSLSSAQKTKAPFGAFGV